MERGDAEAVSLRLYSEYFGKTLKMIDLIMFRESGMTSIINLDEVAGYALRVLSIDAIKSGTLGSFLMNGGGGAGDEAGCLFAEGFGGTGTKGTLTGIGAGIDAGAGI
jgi:hypothetical protein